MGGVSTTKLDSTPRGGGDKEGYSGISDTASCNENNCASNAIVDIVSID